MQLVNDNTRKTPASLVTEFEFDDISNVAGVTFDGELAWFATGDSLVGIDPESGEKRRVFDVPADAGTAFDGEHLWQIAGDKIRRIDRVSGEILATIDAPEGGTNISGMAWADDHLWLGGYKDQRILKVDCATGAVVKVIETDRFVTGVSWTDGRLWCGASYDDQATSEIRQLDPDTGAVVQSVELPDGVHCSGVEVAADSGRIYFGSGKKLRAAELPKN